MAMPLTEVASCLETSVELLSKTNPALTEKIVKAGEPVPKGYLVLVPNKIETALQTVPKKNHNL